MAAREALRKYLTVNVQPLSQNANPNSNPNNTLFALSFNAIRRRFFSEEVRGSFLDKSEVAARVVNVVKNFQKVDPSKQRKKKTSQEDNSIVVAAEIRATGSSALIPGGLAASTQSAATYNAATARDEGKIKLTDVLTGATAKLPVDKVVTKADAEGVTCAEMRNSRNLTAHPGGVAASMGAAARLNENVNV